MQEIWVRPLCWDDALEEEMATHSSILAWRIPWTEEPGGLQSMGSQRDSTAQTCAHTHAHTHTHTQSQSALALNLQESLTFLSCKVEKSTS